MPHQPSLDCPNCGRSPTQNELYCHFCELEIGKMMKIKGKKKFFSAFLSRFKAKK